MRQYWEIKSQYKDSILLFRLGDFYEMFAEDALKAAPVLEVVLTRRNGMHMCGVPHHNLAPYLKKLISKGLKAAICDQLEEASAAKGIIKRGITNVITPGAVIDEVLLNGKENNFLMSVFFDEDLKKGSFAAADISTGDFFCGLTDLKSIPAELNKYNPNEIIVPSKSLKNKTLISVLSQNQKTISGVFDFYFNIEKSSAELEETFGRGFEEKFRFDDKNLTAVCGAVLSYIKESHNQRAGIFTFIKYAKASDSMYLDAPAVKNLEILQSLSDGKVENSLLHILDQTKTHMGARALRKWLIAPLLDISKIKERQDKTAFFIENAALLEETAENLKKISDIERIAARISFGGANLRDFNSLKESLNNACSIIKSLKMPGDNDFDCSIAENISIRISQTITSDPFASLKNGNAIKSGVNEELDSLKTLSRDVKTYISDLENRERQETGIANLKISYNGVFGYFIELTKSNIKLAPARYIRKQTLTNAERYITQELKEFEEKILSAQEKIIRLETFIFDGLKTEIAQYCGEILKIAAKIAETDIFCSFAKNALSYNYCRPEMNESFDLEIIEGRHPVVERILKEGEFCANDVSFSEKERILLLTGPNMSGKSTYLRQTALIAIMAQIGSFVPAQSAKLGIIDRIFTRIGAGDNLAGGQSTFMVEMTETANILNQYGDRSLIILDEIGRGTSTYDGISIAQAILEYLADEKIKSNKGSKILFATHYFELTSLADKAQNTANFTVDVKEWAGEVVFLHKIIRGSADRSYGIHVAKIAGLPKKIIERAFQILEELEKTNFNGSKNEDQNQLDLFSQNQNQQAEFQNQQSAAQNASLIDFDSIDIDNLTPLQALNLLKEIKDKNQK